jgi:hypothetical protein
MNSAVRLTSVGEEVSSERSFSRASEPAAPAVEVRVARSFAEVERIRDAWSAWPSHRDSDIDFCLEFGWTRKQVVRPHVIVLYRQGLPEAMMVGWIERSRLESKIGYLQLPGMRASLLNFSYGGFLGKASAENCRDLVQSILGSLRQGEADVAVLDRLEVGSALSQVGRTLPGFASRDPLPSQVTHHLMALPANVKEVYPALSANHRSELKRKTKKLLAKYPDAVRVRCYREPAEIEAAIPHIEGVAKKTYQRGLGVGFQDDEEMRLRLRVCAEKGWLRAYVLYLADVPCAFWIGTVYNGSFCSDYLAFDPSFAECSPGSFLMVQVIEDFCNAGVREIDFGYGEGRYKEQFGNRVAMESSVWIFAARPKGLALNAIRTSTGAVDSLARKILDKTKLLPRIKKLWRSRAAQTAPAA